MDGAAARSIRIILRFLSAATGLGGPGRWDLASRPTVRYSGHVLRQMAPEGRFFAVIVALEPKE
jgi:hypothetical protein